MSAVEFNQLLLGNSAFLSPFAITLTKDYQSARDLVQDTMYKAISNREKYNAGSNIKAWLYTIMRNIFINNYRKKIKQQAIFDSTSTDFLVDYSQTAISNLAESRLRLKEIHTAIYRLPPIFKDPFLLYIDGYKYYEIAEILHEPIGTVKSRIHFARKLLKKMISRF
jgi:RNA polymerase sigma-70 factor (ECF subfamily)